MDGLQHSERAGCLASFEGPKKHALVASDAWRLRFGTPEAPVPPWQYAEPDTCMLRTRV